MLLIRVSSFLLGISSLIIKSILKYWYDVNILSEYAGMKIALYMDDVDAAGLTLIYPRSKSVIFVKFGAIRSEGLF